MAGKFTRKIYDNCAYQQDTKQSTDPLELIMDVSKYVHCNNICKPSAQYPPNSALLVDVESSLWGIDKLSSKCDTAKHPFCGPNGCLLTKDPRVPPHITPYACERGQAGDKAVITTNMKMPQHPGYKVPNPNICNAQGNGYYVDHNKFPRVQQYVGGLKTGQGQVQQTGQVQQIGQVQQTAGLPLQRAQSSRIVPQQVRPPQIIRQNQNQQQMPVQYR